MSSQNWGIKLHKRAFTLVEIMVAISIFAVVALAATNAFITADRVSKKAQAMKTVIDNLHFALNMISFDLQQGGSYHCLRAGDALLSPGSNPASLASIGSTYSYGYDCHTGTTDGGEGIVFRSPKTGAYALVVYKFNQEDKQIEYWRSGMSEFTPITVSNLQINNLKFYVHNATGGEGNVGSPRVFLTIDGQANFGKDASGATLQTPFQLQTVVSERI